MNDIEFKSTFDEIEFDIAMKMYMKNNSKIASINEHLGEMYSYKDLEDAEALETYDTLQEYKKVLKEKCDAIDKAIETIEQLKEGSYIEYTDTTALAYHTPQSCCVARLDVIENILGGEDNE